MVDPYRSRSSQRSDPSVVPDRGSDVIEWVSGDPDRAEQARAAELARDKPRTTVLAYLDKLLA